MPSSGWPSPERRRASSSAIPESIGPIAAIASMPRSGREPWAANPAVSTSNATKPLWAIATTSSVGSVTIAASAVVRRTSASVPTLPTSSSATAATITSPRKPSRTRRRRRASTPRATPSCRLPRAVEAAFLARGANGLSIPATPTVSMCAFRSSELPPPRAARDADDVGPSRSGLVELDLEPGRAQPVGDERCDLALARTTRDEIRVDRVDLDEPRGQRGELVASRALRHRARRRPARRPGRRPCGSAPRAAPRRRSSPPPRR